MVSRAVEFKEHLVLRFASVVSLVMFATPAFAYIGPGGGLGALGLLVALVLGLVLLLVGFVWFPLKRALKNRRKQTETAREPLDE